MEDEKKFKLFELTENNFFEIFEEVLLLDNPPFYQQNILQSQHFRYFSNYLFFDQNGLLAKTLVLEKKYTCSTYLEDFRNFYSHCYTPYSKECKRIHFFNEKISNDDFLQMVLYGTKNEFKEKWSKLYLGCIVAKPLPKGIFGVTYLKTYDGDKERHRFYTAINSYKINLFGTTCILNTLPYIEQDGIVGSCASSALWMAFQKTADLFHTKKPSPSEITILAGYDSENTGKLFPNKGLEVSQICKAIYNNGLISELRQCSKVIKEISDKNGKHNDTTITKSQFLTWIKGILYAYLKAEIPILLGIEMKHKKFHLITVNGYRFDLKNNISLNYRSDQISKFYAHDDQTGPFSRLKIISTKVDDDFIFLTSWWKEGIELNSDINKIQEYFKKDNNYFTCKPHCIIIPIDRKIKVTYEEIIDKVEILKFIFKIFLGINSDEGNDSKFIYDVYLTRSNKYKEEIRDNDIIEKDKLNNILFESLPIYIWVVKAYFQGELIFDLIFDSIEIHPSGQPFLTNIYSTSFQDLVNSSDKQIAGLFNGDYKDSMYKFISENTYPLSIIEEISEEILNIVDSHSSEINKFFDSIKDFGDDLDITFS